MSDGITKTAVPCACAATCSVAAVIDFEQRDDDPRTVYVEFYESYNGGLRGRLRAAWRVARGKDPWLHALCLYDDGAATLADALRPEAAA